MLENNLSELEVEEKREKAEKEKGSFAKGKIIYPVSVIKVSPEYYEEITRLRYACYLSAYTFLDREKVIEHFESRLSDENYLKSGREYTLKAEHFYFAQVGERVAGIVDYGINSDDEAELNGLYVHPDFQRKGVGKLLFDRAATFFKSLKRDCFILHTPKENIIGRSFYDKMGGEVIREYSRKLIDCAIDVVVYKFKI